VTVDFPSINFVDLTEQTYRILRDRILKRQIHPGEKISVEEIAQSLGVSRTPVVNALKILEADALVEIIPRRGTFVTKITARDIAEVFDIRLMIELYAADQIFIQGKTKELLALIRATLDNMRGTISEESYVNYDEYMASDRYIHTQLVQIVGNQRLSNIYSDLNIHMQIARAHYLNTVESAKQAQIEHEALETALNDSDLAAFKKALSGHITHVKERILVLLEEHGGAL
jgi:DNA-binding GntR family transcriptional regulator